VPAISTKRSSDGISPVRLTDYPGDLPVDSKGNFVTFTSQRDGDWEAYIMDINGQRVNDLVAKNDIINLSQSPTSNDGLPVISPDGSGAAVSDRGSAGRSGWHRGGVSRPTC
jgi:hypothetical protein